MTEEERNDMIADARRFYLAAPLFKPMLEERILSVQERMSAAHKLGERDHTALVAELSVLFDLNHEIEQKDQLYRTLEGQNAKQSER